ncbi:MAG TPA: hypothetical protein VIX91_11535 [Candidatus Acidoferrum sp.]
MKRLVPHERQDAALKGCATQADAIADFGPNNERLDDVKPEQVNSLRELVRQYRQEGIVARRNEIRRIRQAQILKDFPSSLSIPAPIAFQAETFPGRIPGHRQATRLLNQSKLRTQSFLQPI